MAQYGKLIRRRKRKRHRMTNSSGSCGSSDCNICYENQTYSEAKRILEKNQQLKDLDDEIS